MKPAPDRYRDLQRIHCLKRELSLSDDEHRDILFALTRQRSSADLDHAGRACVIDHYAARAKAMGGDRRPAPLSAEWAWAVGHKDEKTLRSLARWCDKAGLAAGGQVAYCEAMLEQRRGCEQPLRFCRWPDYVFLFAALKAQARRS